MFLTIEKINQIIARLEESDKAISGTTARDQLMWGQTTMFFNLGLANKDMMQKGMDLYAKTMATLKSDMMSLISDYQRGSLDYNGAVARFKSVTGTHYQSLFKAGAIAMGNPYYEDPAIGLTKRDLSFIQKARNFESKFLRKFLLDIKNPDFKPKYDFQTRAGFYADSGKTQFFNGMVNGAGDNVEIHWIMSEAVEEHCDDCPVLASKVYTWKTLPTTPRAGDTACLFNCKCELQIVPKSPSAPAGQSFNPMVPGSANPKAMEVPGRWAQVTRGGEELIGGLSKEIEDLYQQMYKARQMITVTTGAEKMDWIKTRRDINAAIIQKAGASKVRVTPTVSVHQILKTVDTALTRSGGTLLSPESFKTGQEVILVRGNFWTPGVIELRGATAIVKTAKGTTFNIDDSTDLVFKVKNKKEPEPFLPDVPKVISKQVADFSSASDYVKKLVPDVERTTGHLAGVLDYSRRATIGDVVPIVVDKANITHIVDGNHRLMAYQQLGILPKVYAVDRVKYIVGASKEGEITYLNKLIASGDAIEITALFKKVESLNEQIDPRSPKMKRLLLKSIFFGNVMLFGIYLQFFTTADAEGSGIPHEVAMIKFRDYYIETPDGWVLRPDMIAPTVENLDEGGQGSGNFGHAGRVGKKGGSKAGTGGSGDYTVSVGKVDKPDDLPSEYQKTWSNWKQEDREKMLLIMKDGSKITIDGSEKGAVTISMKGLDKVLKDNGKGWNDIKVAIHNHNKGEAPSAGDSKYHKAFLNAGFGGDYLVYTPKTGRVQNVPIGKD